MTAHGGQKTSSSSSQTQRRYLLHSGFPGDPISWLSMWFPLKRVGFTAGSVYSFPGAAITNDHNKQQTWLLQTTEIYALTVLRPKFQNRCVCKAIQVVTGIPWCSMACGHNTPHQSLPPSSHLQLCMSVFSFSVSLESLSAFLF